METQVKLCKNCGGERLVGRKLCTHCYKEYRKEYMKQRYIQKGRYKFSCTCNLCSKQFEGNRKDQLFCKSCFGLVSHMKAGDILSNNNYYIKKEKTHRKIVEEILQRKLNSNECIHHLNGNIKDNSCSNLIIISRHNHSKLHLFLRRQRAVIEKSMNENVANCWNTLIIPITTTWLETAGVNVIKILEIGQSAAKLHENVEGSETIHDIPLSMGNDIVQTTT